MVLPRISKFPRLNRHLPPLFDHLSLSSDNFSSIYYEPSSVNTYIEETMEGPVDFQFRASAEAPFDPAGGEVDISKHIRKAHLMNDTETSSGPPPI